MPDWSQVFKRRTPAQPVKPKSALREWLEALVVAGGLAILIRTFLIEAFMIPTPSMERSLMVGDFLFVSKLHYGPRLPMAPLSIPFMHNRILWSNIPSFLDWVTFPYARIPGFTEVKRGDVIVFNFPAEDLFPNHPDLGPLNIPSVKENYIKRCVAVGGDTVQVKEGELYINGKQEVRLPTMSSTFNVQTTAEGFNPKVMKRLGFRKPGDAFYQIEDGSAPFYRITMSDEVAGEIKRFDNVRDVRREVYPKELFDARSYPADPALYRWNVDHFGPVWVPKKGATVELNAKTLPLYRRCISVYEHHTLVEKDGQVTIDGKPATSYTFEMNYYFAMGDNRHNSQDGRVWGFVPEDHLVGKPLFVLFSWEGGPRWNRFFHGVN
jgi:signal peptidase I